MVKKIRNAFENNESSFFLKNIDKIPVVERLDVYFDYIVEKTNSKVKLLRRKIKGSNPETKRKETELYKIGFVKQMLINKISKIINSFPIIDNLSKFNINLMSCFIDLRELKSSLNKIDRIMRIIGQLERDIRIKIQKSRDIKEMTKLRKEFYGRVSSLLKKNRNAFESLEKIRRNLKKIPVIDEGLYTVAITGFPNVGKSTLLKKLTNSNVEIKDYAFTTKQLMIGKITLNYQEIQVIDTPGVLNRDKKMNSIEKQAKIVYETLANLVVFVFDLTETVPLKKQIQLYRKIKEKIKETNISMRSENANVEIYNKNNNNSNKDINSKYANNDINSNNGNDSKGDNQITNGNGKNIQEYKNNNRIMKNRKIIIYLSKVDIIEEKKIEEFKEKYHFDFFTDATNLKKEIIRDFKSYKLNQIRDRIK
ncbi:MAG: GTP-binding protein [Nitrospiraceae bacterium]|nr:GTP-binding protein [Nitrospiraceae bacterium]